MAARNPGLCQLLLVCVVAVAISGAIGVAGVIIEGSVSVSELYRDATVVVVGGEEEEEAKMSSGITGGIDAGEQLGKVWTLEEIYEELQVQSCSPFFSFLSLSLSHSLPLYNTLASSTLHFHLSTDTPQNHE